MEAAEDGETGQDPPAVTNIRQLLRSTIEATGGELPLCQPPAQPVLLDGVEVAGDGEAAEAGVDEAGVRLRARAGPEAAVKVLRRRDEVGSLVGVQSVQPAQQSQAGQTTDLLPSLEDINPELYRRFKEATQDDELIELLNNQSSAWK